MSSKLLYRFPSSPTTSPLTSGEHLPVRDFHSSTDTVHRIHTRTYSEIPVGFSSPAPYGAGGRNENRISIEQASPTTSRYHKNPLNISWPRQIPKPVFQHAKVQNETPSIPQTPSTPESTIEVDSLAYVDLNAGCGEDSGSDEGAAGDMSGGFQPRLSFDPASEDTLETRKALGISRTGGENQSPSYWTPFKTRSPFRRWMRSLRYRSPGHKSPSRRHSLTVRQERWSLDDCDEQGTIKPTQSHSRKRSGHKKTSSWSSSGLVTAVKSATVGLAATQSPKAKRLSLLRSSQRSSGASQATARDSSDSHVPPRMDDAAWERARQRRRTIEELIESEEGYIADLKVLDNVSLFHVSYRGKPEADRLSRCI